MSLIESVKTVFSKYAVFNGRARRSEFWWYTLVVGIVMNVLYFALVVPQMTAAVQAAAADPTATAAPATGGPGAIIVSLVALAIFLPSLGVTIRRLHDTDRSGFWYFLQLIPLVGGIILLVFLAQAGTPGPNKFGEDPKAA